MNTYSSRDCIMADYDEEHYAIIAQLDLSRRENSANIQSIVESYQHEAYTQRGKRGLGKKVKTSKPKIQYHGKLPSTSSSPSKGRLETNQTVRTLTKRLAILTKVEQISQQEKVRQDSKERSFKRSHERDLKLSSFFC